MRPVQPAIRHPRASRHGFPRVSTSKAKDQLQQDEIAARQCFALRAFPTAAREEAAADVKEMLLQMKGAVG